jgi:hypothetical protein
MRRSLLFWTIAVVLTVASAAYQRLTGPTYPVSGSAVLNGYDLRYRFDRSHGGDGDHRVVVRVADPAARGTMRWKRLNTSDAWSELPLTRNADSLIAMLPWQPPAGKLEYQAHLTSGAAGAVVPPDGPVVIRFKGDVPPGILIPHILAMFAAMLFSMRAGIEALATQPRLTGLTAATLVALVIGGAILGPVMQKFAFGAYWTGWPFGHDLTDNKTVLALAGWIAAAIALRRASRPARWVLAASLLLFVVYLIPHSVLGSELDYGTLNAPPQVP